MTIYRKHLNLKIFQKDCFFVNKVGKLAEEMQHHPYIKIVDYNNVNIRITTHNEGDIVTEKDRSLAKAIESIQIIAKFVP